MWVEMSMGKVVTKTIQESSFEQFELMCKHFGYEIEISGKCNDFYEIIATPIDIQSIF